MSTLIVKRGLPASGKTTSALAWVAEDPALRARVNRDDLRAMLFAEPTYAWEQEQLVTTVARDTVRALLAAGRDVVVDDTNLRPKYVREWARFARSNGAEVEIHEHHLDVDEAIARDAARDRTVGEDVIRRMALRYMPGGRFLPVPDDSLDEAPAAAHYVAPFGVPPAVIVDIDGTLALHNGRDPYDLTRCGDDLPNAAVIDAVRAAATAGCSIIYCSGREDSAHFATVQWLSTHVRVPGQLLMRDAGDRRKDSVVKRELFDQHIRDRYDVRYVFDDRQQVVDMWRDELGLTVFQVARGDF